MPTESAYHFVFIVVHIVGHAARTQSQIGSHGPFIPIGRFQAKCSPVWDFKLVRVKRCTNKIDLTQEQVLVTTPVSSPWFHCFGSAPRNEIQSARHVTGESANQHIFLSLSRSCCSKPCKALSQLLGPSPGNSASRNMAFGYSRDELPLRAKRI